MDTDISYLDRDKKEVDTSKFKYNHGRSKYLPLTRETMTANRIGRQDMFLELLPKCSFNIAKTCRKINISRRTFERWLTNEGGYGEGAVDENNEPITFRERFDGLVEEILDLTEEKLIRNINRGDTASIFFMLKTKGKKRGWDEKTDINVTHTIISKEQADAAVRAVRIQHEGTIFEGLEAPETIFKNLIEKSKENSKILQERANEQNISSGEE